MTKFSDEEAIMKAIKRLGSVLCVLVIVALLSSAVFADVLLGWDLVDSGKHCDWGGSTAYSSAWVHGLYQWNGCDYGEVIRLDTIWTIKDLNVSDYYEQSNTIAVTGFLGYIKFNTYQMDSLSYDQKECAATHELGHALGINHLSVGDIMYTYVQDITELSFYDKATFDMAYETY
jgi:hypothetical protein